MKRALGFLAVFTFAIAAHAQSNDAGIASQLFDAGRDLMKRGDYASACPKLSESARLEPRVGTLARLAECEEKIGHLAAARGHWKDTTELARAQKDDRAAHAEDEFKRVDAIVPRLILKPQSTPPGFAVQLDDVAVGVESMSLPLPIDPGHHAIVATATNKQPWRGAVDARANGATTTLEIPALVDEEAHAVVTSTPSTPVPRIDHPVATHRPLANVGGVILSVGLGVVAMGAGFGGAALAVRDGTGCSSVGVCPSQSAKDSYDTARTFADVSTTAFIAGGVVAAAGIILVLVAPKTPIHSALRVGPFGIGGVF